MPVIFGDTREDGKLVVGCVQWQIESHPNGTTVAKVPDYPAPETGKDAVMLYDKITGEFSFEQKERPLNEQEQMEKYNILMMEKLDTIINLLSK